MSNDIVQRATGLVNAFDARVQQAPAGSWGNPSPCAEWTARDVAVHVTNNVARVGHALNGQPSTEVGADDDIVAAWNSARDTFVSAVASADLSQLLPGPFGDMPATDLIGRFVCNDILVHTWDLARATGGDEQLDPDAVSGAYAGLKPLDAMIRRPGVFGPAAECAADADEQTQFLAFLGRQV
jgi:uncharacterized protein (TIGR03086 family)